MELIFRFLREYIRWNLAGRPLRNEEQMKEIFKICEGCPFFEQYAPNVKYGTCGKCGCNLHEIDKGRNKIAWATTRCPDQRW